MPPTQFRVYDAPSRRAGAALIAALALGMLAAFGTLLLVPHRGTRIPNDSYLVVIFPALLILPLFAAISLVTGARIRIERATGEVLQSYALLGWEVRRQRFRLSDFDRVSLTRAFRGGYRVSLVGREQDLMIFVSSKLGPAREQAEKLAVESGLKVIDQL